MKKEYYKLVRNNIPKIMAKDGSRVKYQVLSDTRLFQLELENKLDEELNELKDGYAIEEFADVLEVLKEIATLRGINWSDIIDCQDKKREEKGGFSEKIFLEYEETI